MPAGEHGGIMSVIAMLSRLGDARVSAGDDRSSAFWPRVAWVLCASHMTITASATGFRWEYFFVNAALIALASVPRTRKISLLALPFYLVGVLYEGLGAVLGLRGEIHIADVYGAELSLFGLSTPKGILTPPEFLLGYTHAAFDLICGAAYIAYVLVPPLLVLWLYHKKDQHRASSLAWMFLGVNVLGMLTWILFPVAPPWYVMDYGLGSPVLDAAPSAAGAARFDALLGVSYFREFYSRNQNIFGAFPSLHTAYPTITFLAVWGANRWLTAALGAFSLLVGFSAVYLQHHYVLDVLAGFACAVLAFLLVRALLSHFGQSTVNHVDAL
jgi:membrane-associated phospholipid phosphatase